MYLEKASSTNKLNKTIALSKCPVTFTLEMIGGRWKTLIIYNLLSGPLRYAALKRSMPAITEKMLIQQLKELENDGLIVREVKPVVPPHVTYSLTDMGYSLKEVLFHMAEWGLTYQPAQVANCNFTDVK